MTSASKERVQRRARKLAEKATSFKAGDAPKAIITLTEIPGTGGFQIGLGLHGARMEEIDPGGSHPVSIVDVIALAVTSIIRQQPKDFQDAVNLVNSTLRGVQEQIEGGADVSEAMAGADELLGGAIADVEAPEEDEAANG